MSAFNTSPDRSLKRCVVPTCKGNRYDLVHKFPMNKERALQWLDSVGAPELTGMSLDHIRKRFFVCTRHFRKEDYKNCESRSLNTTAYPRLLLKCDDNDAIEPIISSTDYQIADDEIQTFECDPSEELHDVYDTKIDSTGEITITLTRENRSQSAGQRQILLNTSMSEKKYGGRLVPSIVSDIQTKPPNKKRIVSSLNCDNSNASIPEQRRPANVTDQAGRLKWPLNVT